MFKTLIKNFKAKGYGNDHAKNFAKKALRQNKSKRRYGEAGGQGFTTQPMNIIEDSCEDTAKVTCDPRYKHRTFHGQCNNLAQTGYEGSAGMPFSRFAVVHDNVDPIKNMTFYLTKIVTSHYHTGGWFPTPPTMDQCQNNKGKVG